MKKLIVGNWKMNKSISQAAEFLKEIKGKIKSKNADVVICAPFTILNEVNKLLKKSSIKLGAQNMYFEEKGAFTGEISAEMLKDVGCTYVIIGHSERRHYFHEDNILIHKKLKKALEHHLTPIFCVGETLEERKGGKTHSTIKEQIQIGLKGLDASKVVIAYEPVWAIGTGNTATPQQAQEVHQFIRKMVGKNTIIIYGGSVNPYNCKDLLTQKDIDGAFPGGASLKPKDFSEIINSC